MAKKYRLSWDPCLEFKNKSQLESSSDFREHSKSLVQEITLPSGVKTIAKASRKELSEIKATWKSLLPNLSTEDVRRYRIPHYEVAILELEETGYTDAAQCMKMLFTLDEEMRIKAGPGTAIWTNPRLKDRVDFIDRLKVGLAEANRAMLREQRVSQAALLLETALYFQKTTCEWWWVAEQLFRSSLSVSQTIEDDEQTVTLVRYLYGRFLFNEMKDTNGSLKFLNESRKAAEGKVWSAAKILGIKQDSLFRECCTLLYRVFVSRAIKAREYDSDLAVKACREALKHAMDSDHDEYITNATCELGRSYLRANQPKLALQNFIKYLNLSRKILDYEGICNSHMELAFAYKELDDAEKTMEHLELFRETASRFQLPNKLAQAHYLIGEHLLTRNHLSQATSHLEFAFTLYNGMGQTADAHKARCIAAVSKGQEYVDQYIEQILKCGKCDKTATLKICHWKNDRVPFWRTRKLYSDDSCDERAGNDIPESEESYSDYEISTPSTEIAQVVSFESIASNFSADFVPDEIGEENVLITR